VGWSAGWFAGWFAGGVDDEISSAGAGAEIIGVVKAGAEVGMVTETIGVISGVAGGVSSAESGAETIGVVKIGAEVGSSGKS
jgi:hypothetical protein